MNDIAIEVFDEEHEKDLQYNVNAFLSTLGEDDLIDIKYAINAFLGNGNEQIYCYSAMVIYRKKRN